MRSHALTFLLLLGASVPAGCLLTGTESDQGEDASIDDPLGRDAARPDNRETHDVVADSTAWGAGHGSGSDRVGPVGTDNGQRWTCTGPQAGQAVLCVAAGSALPGLGTAASPYPTIGAAVTSSKSGDVIQVSAGTYAENVVVGSLGSPVAKTLTFLGGFQVGSSFAVRDATAYPTVISGGATNPAVRLHVNTASAMAFDGFELTNGLGLGSHPRGDGGGLYVEKAGAGTLTISHNHIHGNITRGVTREQYGGGMFAVVTGAGQLRIEDNRVRNNDAGQAGGIYAQGANVSVLRNLVELNDAMDDHGGGIYLAVTSATVTDNLIRNNRVGVNLSYSYGGGIVFVGSTAGTTRGNVLVGNHAKFEGSAVFWDDDSHGSMNNDLIYQNLCAAGGSGSAVFINERWDGVASSATLRNVTIADHGCTAIYVQGGSVDVFDSIIWDNDTDFSLADWPDDTASASNSTTDLPGAGNQTSDPLFVNAAGGDYHLQSTEGHYSSGGWVLDAQTSPAIDRGNTASAFANEPAPHGGRVNQGAYGNTAEASKTPDAGQSGADTCPGEARTLTLDAAALSLTGTTLGSLDDEDTCYQVEAGLDRVYHFTTTQAGTLTFRLTDNAANANLVMREGVCTAPPEEWCSSLSGGKEALALEATPGEYYVLVDSVGVGGAYTLTASLTTPVCGDFVVNAGEACDPGGVYPSDGCSNSCAAEAPLGGGGTCPGATLNVPGGSTSVLAAAGHSTYGHGNGQQSRDCTWYQTGGPERIYQLIPGATGNLTVRAAYDTSGNSPACNADPLGPQCWDVALYARSTCIDQATELACADDSYLGESISFPVTVNTPVFLFVDGYAPAETGHFNLHFNLQ